MSDADEIRGLERQRSDAMIRADRAALESLFDDELVWTHSSARVDSKQGFIDTVLSGAVRYLKIEISDQVVRIHGTLAVTTGLAAMRALLKGEERDLFNRYTAVWSKRSGNWRMVAWQST